MSKSTKRKFVTAEVRDSFDVLPDKDKGERIVRLVAPRGNNLHEVEAPVEQQQDQEQQQQQQQTENFLVSMPNKFRKNVWVKRGDFVIVAPIEEGDKVKGEIATVLYKEQIKYIKSEGLWPKVFEEEKKEEEGKKKEEEEEENSDSDNSSDDDDDDLFKNTNRPVVEVSEDDEDDSSEEEEEEDSEEEEEKS